MNAHPLLDGRIYDGIEARGLTTDLRGWHSTDPIFASVINETKPQTIVEVGSWKGASAIHMASLTKAWPCRIVCVDTWLGGFELLDDPFNPQTARVPREHGYPMIYFQFLHNVAACGFADRITPLPMTSRDGARFLRLAANKANLVYIDGSHIEEDVIDDLSDYWPLVAEGGILFGDDYPCAGVARAVEAFCDFHNIGFEVAGRFFVMRKGTTLGQRITQQQQRN